MKKENSHKEMKRILKQNLEVSALTEERIQEAYRHIRREAEVNMTIQKRKGNGRYLAAAAVIGVLAISSVTVLAVNGFFEKRVQEETGTVDYEFQVDTGLTMNEVVAEPGYIPAGYEKIEEGKYDKEGYSQNGISIEVVNAVMLDADGERLSCDNVKELEKTMIGGKEAHLLTLSYDKDRITRTFDKRIYLFVPEEGYVGVIYGGNDISMDELKKVAENLQFIVTDQKSEWVTKEEEEVGYWWKERTESVPKSAIVSVGETMDIDSMGLRLTVKEVEIADTVEGLDKDCFFEYDSRVAPYLTEEGSLMPYDRVTMKVNEDAKEEEVSRDSVTQKFVKVTLTAENLMDEQTELWAGEANLMNLLPQENGDYGFHDTWTEPLNSQEYILEPDSGYPIYFDKTPYAGEMNGHFFFCDLAPGEIMEYTLVFAKDEDQLDNLYLQMCSLSQNLVDGVYQNLFVELNA